MNFWIRRQWNLRVAAWCSFGIALAALGCAYIFWPPFDRDFWFELAFFAGGLTLSLVFWAMAAFKSGSKVKRWLGVIPALLAVSLLGGIVLAVGVLQQAGASIESFRTRENRGASHAHSNHLVYVRLKSRASGATYPIVYLAGGPGGSGIVTLLGWRQPVFMAMREFGDVIALDQRGTMPWNMPWLMCPGTVDYPLDRPYDPQSNLEIAGPYLRDCATHYREEGVDLPNYNTVENADDLEDLRIHLGAEKITLWGTSYGTHLAMTYMKRHPDRVHRAILHGVEGPDHTLKLPSDTEAMLSEIARRAAAVPALQTPDLVGDLRRIMSQVEAKPVEVTVSIDGKDIVVVLGKYDVQLHTALRLASPWSSMQLPATVAEMKRGDFSRYARAAVKSRRGQRYPLMAVQMDCASGATADRRARIEREIAATVLGDAINDPFPGICRFVDAPDLGDEFRSLRTSGLPILFISGTLDGRTPPSNTEDVRSFYPNSHHVIVDGAGHGDDLFHGSPQILQGMQEFMRGQGITATNPLFEREFEAVRP